jgi:hypothetical protein
VDAQQERRTAKDQKGAWARNRARDLTWELRRWSYIDLGGGPEDTVFVAGPGRSGTTWIEEVINRNHDHRVMFEPFWGRHVPELRSFADHQYLRPGNSDNRFVEPVARILSGRVRNRWIDHHNTVRLPRKRLVKEIRANNWLGWAAERWPAMPMVFIIRHPMAVASSGMALGWGDGLERILAQQHLLPDHFDEDSQEYLRSLTDPWERSIARWCVENLIPFHTLGSTRATLVVYEALASHSEDEAGRLVAAVGQAQDSTLEAAIDKPSRLTRPGGSMGSPVQVPNAWLDKVDVARRRQGLEVVRRLGFGDVYDDGPMPDVQAAHQLWSESSTQFVREGDTGSE